MTVIRFEFFWSIPNSDVDCGKTARFTMGSFRFTGVSYRYEVTAPDPQSMASGRYQGKVTFSVGPGGDIDYGDKVQPGATTFTVNFDLTVNHVLQATFPPGSDKLDLSPEGGWMQWIQRGRRPEKLSIDQRFNFSTNNDFKMHIECQYPMGTQCGIANENGHQVPVQTHVSFPAGITDASGQAVNRQLLNSVDKHVFQPKQLVSGSRSNLYFEVGRDDVKEMVDHHAGSHYSGNVTVVWDSDIAAP
ncbi:hypothetical protein [Pseudomonas sp. JUb96]|uniref:hypothetical protein n=1 Tax=Pseudomonas sp. JUb96 TaxID=2940539 RepID=UPI002226B727|nr:hypothetical protein [Pseudomonas sp. JUb96]MCW2271597.1 hypothetical protein [Pseudomonas sp. JUb96]